MPRAKTSLTGKDLLLLLLYVPGYHGAPYEPVLGRTRLTKMVFLFEKEVWPEFKFDRIVPDNVLPVFFPHHFGPFSQTVYSDLDFLANLGFVLAETNSNSQVAEEEALEYEWWLREAEQTVEQPTVVVPEIFRLTDTGIRFAFERLVPILSQDQTEALATLKARCSSVPLRQLLRYVYTRYSEFAVNSAIKEQVFTEWGEDPHV